MHLSGERIRFWQKIAVEISTFSKFGSLVMVMTSLVSAVAGLQQNVNGGAFVNGKEYGTGKKVEVEMVFWQMKVASRKNPSEQKLAEEAGVGKTCAKKIIDEINETGGIVPVKYLKEERWERKEKGVDVYFLTLFE